MFSGNKIFFSLKVKNLPKLPSLLGGKIDFIWVIVFLGQR